MPCLARGLKQLMMELLWPLPRKKVLRQSTTSRHLNLVCIVLSHVGNLQAHENNKATHTQLAAAG